ncbi:SPW repeat protein [Candidatus Wolfebacteria bacterium]|nr:SPW repeat protein [Candidatus Wolfebacteria bacterium]
MKYLNWVQLILGVWVFVSPWILGFSDITTALWSNIIAGALIVIFSLWEIFGSKSASIINETSPSASSQTPPVSPTE